MDLRLSAAISTTHGPVGCWNSARSPGRSLGRNASAPPVDRIAPHRMIRNSAYPSLPGKYGVKVWATWGLVEQLP